MQAGITACKRTSARAKIRGGWLASAINVHLVVGAADRTLFIDRPRSTANGVRDDEFLAFAYLSRETIWLRPVAR